MSDVMQTRKSQNTKITDDIVLQLLYLYVQ
jgi:hypothetical protein